MGTPCRRRLLARLDKRLHPSLACYERWAFWSMLLGGMAALGFALGFVRL